MIETVGKTRYELNVTLPVDKVNSEQRLGIQCNILKHLWKKMDFDTDQSLTGEKLSPVSRSKHTPE